MKLHPLPWFRVISTLSQNPLALLGGVLLCLSPIAARGQSVTFAGAQRIPPSNGLGLPTGAAVDDAGNVFISDASNGFVLELPRTAIGYGPNAVLPLEGHPQGIATDLAGDVFVSRWSYNDVVESPKTATGFGPQTTLPFTGLSDPWGVAVDNSGDVFVIATCCTVLELPWTGTGYGPQTVLPFSGLDYPVSLAVDSDKNVFVANGNVLELPKTATGYGPQIALPSISPYSAEYVAVDSAGNVFINAAPPTNPPYTVVLELPKTGVGYGPPITLPFSGVGGPDFCCSVNGLAVDSEGDVFVADGYNAAAVELQTVSVDFWGVNVCAPGATTPAPCSQTLTLTYNVNANTTLGEPQVATGGLKYLDFNRASGSTCIGAVTAGTTCTVNVTFTPLAAGFRNGSVIINDDSSNRITTTPLSGFGIAATTGAPVAQLSTGQMSFGTIDFGTIKTLPLFVANIGGGTLTVAPSVKGASYNISDSTCAAGVTPGNSCTLVVEYSPRSIAPHDDTLTVATNGGSPIVGLWGSVAGLSVLGGGNAETLVFGTTSPGSTETRTLTVTNVGLPGTVIVGTAISGLSFSVLTEGNTCLAGIAAGQSCILPVQFAPTHAGLHDELLTLTPFPGAGLPPYGYRTLPEAQTYRI